MIIIYQRGFGAGYVFMKGEVEHNTHINEEVTAQ
jgi:hypothetical protein